MVKIATFNVENLFSRPKALNPLVPPEDNQPILDAYRGVSDLLVKAAYNDDDKKKICEHFVTLGIYRKYRKNGQDVIRRYRTQYPKWAWFRKNRGAFDRQPKDATKDVVITAKGSGSWIGWVELDKKAVNDTGVKMTARVIKDVKPDIIGIVEAEDRPSLVRFNKDLLDNYYEHVMLVDGNDRRGIDVGIMTAEGFEIKSIRSNVDAKYVDAKNNKVNIFSRDCPQYEIRTPSGSVLHVLVNHFKSKIGGSGDDKRERQAKEVRRIVDELVARDQHVVVLGDFNQGPEKNGIHGKPSESLKSLFDSNGPLFNCFTHTEFDVGKKPGTYDDCSLTNRFDNILISRSLEDKFHSGGVFRKGLWGSTVNKPKGWDTYQEMEEASEQASDHALVYIELNI